MVADTHAKKIILAKALISLVLTMIPIGIVIYGGTKHTLVDEKKKN